MSTHVRSSMYVYMTPRLRSFTCHKILEILVFLMSSMTPFKPQPPTTLGL